ncbi:uncharacterized protein GVI51_I00517 [Nakaseomyces glabratus]|uniref:Ribophorin II C-terminal domain-containing protein n=2 Tax=Candida glabrata TaxID=5478 RepID=Q6FR60_CANGA|nr:uncharacterized protein CAGL0I00704g [Nakaseomyces glabratus]KAH7580556.1 Oligosaccharyltransferase subunit Ribophorin II [Nakaseomyces glabratus]KAH7585594.1 Oligosaccharyltransferase subunit Ribophorin II [Nakaseomyces glabratus]KAH7587282.1 Oligosaccharyltransferase subunit Ribophorin II [Nakaseomyces glabratus]KAH7599226.1 Oligosaccharyltransferase subunit Ribophorin II [Nakaseomyces glabratus]KAH7599540.1 Oligosaccharyltransferase subunit Ribophorin II [Nakaseomyces glabratus]|eukprot:XP_447284.1 uncharacterized protein CAGL0I00704g [[Candida] glabrata]
MRWSQLALFSIFSYITLALRLTDVNVINYTDDEKKLLTFKEVSADIVTDQQLKVIEVTIPDAIYLVTFKSETPLDQANVYLGHPDKSLEVVYPIKERAGDIYLFEINMDKLDKNLLAVQKELGNKPLAVTVVAASKDDSEGVLKTLFYMQLQESMLTEELPQRELAIKKELAHTFNKPPTHAPKLFAQLFALIILATFAALVITWFAAGAVNFGNMPKGNFIYFIGFVVTIVGFEYIFTQYQLGTGIFETINRAICLGVPGIWISAKFLRSVEKPL